MVGKVPNNLHLSPLDDYLTLDLFASRVYTSICVSQFKLYFGNWLVTQLPALMNLSVKASTGFY